MPESTSAPWIRRLLLVLSVVGPLCGAVTAVVVTVLDIRSSAREASQEAEAGYETLAPAVEELQDILADTQQWGDAVDGSLLELQKLALEQERRILRLEAYLEVLSSRRRLPTLPEEAPESDAELEPHPARARAPRPSRPVPQDVKRARSYQQQRLEQNCLAQDPLCGM